MVGGSGDGSGGPAGAAIWLRCGAAVGRGKLRFGGGGGGAGGVMLATQDVAHAFQEFRRLLVHNPFVGELCSVLY